MGKVLQLNKRKPPAEGSKEEEALVSELFKKFVNITDRYHDVVICKAVAVYMGTLMMTTDKPGTIIGGFMNHIEAVANIAITQHRKLELQNAPKVLGTTHPEGGPQDDPAQSGQPGSEGTDPSQGGDRNLEVEEGQEVLLPPTLQ